MFDTLIDVGLAASRFGVLPDTATKEEKIQAVADLESYLIAVTDSNWEVFEISHGDDVQEKVSDDMDTNLLVRYCLLLLELRRLEYGLE